MWEKNRINFFYLHETLPPHSLSLEPRRIAAVPDVILDIIVSDDPPVITDSAILDMVAALQRNVQELLLNSSHPSSTTVGLTCKKEPKTWAENDHVNNSPENDNSENNNSEVNKLEYALGNRGHEAIERFLQDNNHSNAIESRPLGATSNYSKRPFGPQDYATNNDMSLMETMINASHGDAQAQAALGDRYKDGRVVKQDYHAAMEWYFKAAEQGHRRAQYNIGLFYKQGHGGVIEDATKAFEWLLKSAIQEFADAQAMVSEAYTEGTGVPKDNIIAMEWLFKAGENGHSGAQYNLGAAYENGHGVPQSDSKAFAWYLKSAERGFGKAQVRVAAAFEHGRGVPQDDIRAVEWYAKAAHQGIAGAQFSLGLLHHQGAHGLPKDNSKAVDWFIKAAKQGHIYAQSLLRRTYSNHVFGSDAYAIKPLTESKVIGWFIEAADQGVAHAQYCMGCMYEKGLGTCMDYSLSFEWYLKAAEQGHEESQFHVARMYLHGVGVSFSHEKAVEWFTILAKGGNAGAVEYLKNMTRK